MKNKFLAILVLVLCLVPMNASAEHFMKKQRAPEVCDQTLRDAFNNDIFDVVKEVSEDEARELFLSWKQTKKSSFGYEFDGRYSASYKSVPYMDYLYNLTEGGFYPFIQEVYFSSWNENGQAIMIMGKAAAFDTIKGITYEYAYYLVQLKKPACISVFLDDKSIDFDQLPVIEEGRTLVPLRKIFETLGAEVNWDGDTQTVTATKDGTEIKLTVGNTTAFKNGEAINIDVPAKIINGRTLVPVRFIADCFNVETNWNQSLQQVILTTK